MEQDAEAKEEEGHKGRERPLPRPVLILGSIGVVAALAFAVTAALIASRSTNGTGIGTGTGTGTGQMAQSATLVTYTGRQAVRADPLHLARLGGGPAVTLRQLGRAPIVLNFFASWCTACQSELKAVAEVAGEGLVGFVGVDTNETSYGAALRMLRRADARYPVGIGSTTQASEYRAPGLPTTVFIDKQGRVVAEAFGAVTRSQLSHWVRELASGSPVRE